MSQQLSHTQERHPGLQQKLQLIQMMLQQVHPATRQMVLLENMELDVLDAMEHCCSAKQQLLRYRLAVCMACRQEAERGRNENKELKSGERNITGRPGYFVVR